MAEIDRLRELVKSEVGEALATMQQRVDDALANADATAAQRDAVQAEFDGYKARAAGLGDEIAAPGLYGQDPAPEPDPEA